MAFTQLNVKTVFLILVTDACIQVFAGSNVYGKLDNAFWRFGRLPPLIEPCPRNWVQRPGHLASHCYLVNRYKFTWKRAEYECRRMNGHLASIQSKEENRFVKNLILTMTTKDAIAWLGAKERHISPNSVLQEWRWSDNSKFGYKNWLPGRPLVHGGYYRNQKCIQMVGGWVWGGRWTTEYCRHRRNSVCKREARYYGPILSYWSGI